MTASTKQLVTWVFDLGRTDITDVVLETLRELPEVTTIHVDRGDLEGNFVVELSLDADVSLYDYFERNFPKVLDHTTDGKCDEVWYYPGLPVEHNLSHPDIERVVVRTAD